MKKATESIIALFLYVCMLFIFIVNSFYSVEADDAKNTAQAYVLIEAATGRILDEYNSENVLPAGTMNKLMTVLLTAEAIRDGKLSYGQEITVSSSANGAAGATIWLMTGEKMILRDILKGIIIGNANDAAIAAAEAVCTDTESFTKLMNDRAGELGMQNTCFTAPGGVDDENQHTTAYDIALLTREIIKHDFLKDIMTTWLDHIRGEDTELVNENTLVRTYKGILGVKAGHSEKSGYSLATAAQRNGDTYIAVVLGCSDKDERFAVGKKLLNTGFSSYKTVTPGFSTENMMPVRVKHGVDMAVEIKAEKLPPLVIIRGAESKMKCVVFLPEYIDAPVRKNQKLGTVSFYSGETLLYETPLIAADNVQKNTFLKSVKRIVVKMFK